MRRTIETAPRDGNAIILEDDAIGTYDVAHWSAEADEWVGENGEPSKITPTHWYPLQGDNYLQQGHDISSSPSLAGPSASRAHRYSFSFPFSLRRAPPQRSAASDVIAPRSVAAAAPVTVGAFEAQTAPVEAKRALHVRRGFAASSIAAALVAAALIGTAYVTRYAGQQDILGVSTIGGPVVEQATRLPSQDSRKTDLLALQQQAEADQARAQAGAQEAAQVKQAAEASAPEARQSLEKEQRPEVLANELAEARRAIDGLNLQLQAGATRTAQLLGQEREKTAALVQDATAARQELTASMVQHRHALEEESARSAALANELAMARREIETQVALLRKAGDEAVDVEQKPAAVEERPGVSLPAWANSDAFVKPAQTAKQPDVAPENSKPAIKPVEAVPLPRERAMSADVGYCSQRYRSYDPASGTYTDYDGRRHSCRSPDDDDCSQRYRTYDPASGTHTGYDGGRHFCR
jgi:hypothetical protein